MLIGKLVRAHKSDETGHNSSVIVEADQMDTHIKLVGSSMPASVPPGTDTKSFMIRSDGEMFPKGVIALQALNKGSFVGAICEVDWTRRESPLNLARPFFPRYGVFGQVINGHLRVEIGSGTGGRTYTDDPRKPERFEGKWFVVPNGDILCSFLADDCGEQQLIDHATALAAEKTLATKYAELQAEHADLKNRVAKNQDAQIYKQHYEDLKREFDLVKKTVVLLWSQYERLHEMITNTKKFGRWGLRKKLSKLAHDQSVDRSYEIRIGSMADPKSIQ